MANPTLVTGAAGRVGAVGRTVITFQDIPVEPWRDALLERGWPVHVVNHLTAMADLHRAGRFDRMSDDVRTLTGQGPLSVQEVVRMNAATFTASAGAARVSATKRTTVA
jgi:nucleoside-diphosphate-sugar epimerase